MRDLVCRGTNLRQCGALQQPDCWSVAERCPRLGARLPRDRLNRLMILSSVFFIDCCPWGGRSCVEFLPTRTISHSLALISLQAGAAEERLRLWNAPV